VSARQASDQKTERLVNLLLALISDRSFRSKNELLNVVAGYEGSPSTRERMFERDKEELRSIGVPIEVKILDPLFEDEVGYRIPKERFLISIPDLTPQESILLAAASYLALPNELRNEKNELKRRLYSLAVYPQPAFMSNKANMEVWSKFFSYPSKIMQSISKALFATQLIQFYYLRQSDGEYSQRKIAPYGLYVKSHEIFMIGYDYQRDDYRTFNLDYIASHVEVLDEKFVRRSDFEIARHYQDLVRSTIPISIEVPTELETRFLALGGKTIAQSEEKVQILFDVGEEESFFRALLTASNEFKIISPDSVDKKFQSWLKALLDDK